MVMGSGSYRPLNQDPKMATSRAMTGSDIRRFTVYCANPSCRLPVNQNGHEAMPSMNYHGTKFTLFPQHRIHVFVCSICNAEKRYRRTWFGKEWRRIR